MVGSLKAATDISKALLELKVTAEVQGKVIDLQSALLSAQQSALDASGAQFDLQERVRTLEAEIRALNDWGDQEKRYALVSPWGGADRLFALKMEYARGEAPHYLCPNCFFGRKRSTMNAQKVEGWVILVCPRCKARVDTTYRAAGPPQFAEDCAREG